MTWWCSFLMPVLCTRTSWAAQRTRKSSLRVLSSPTSWVDAVLAAFRPDYADRTGATIRAWQGMDGTQGGDPAKLAEALIRLAALDQPPFRCAAGADAVELFESKARTLLAQAAAHRDLSISLAHDDS